MISSRLWSWAPITFSVQDFIDIQSIICLNEEVLATLLMQFCRSVIYQLTLNICSWPSCVEYICCIVHSRTVQTFWSLLIKPSWCPVDFFNYFFVSWWKLRYFNLLFPCLKSKQIHCTFSLSHCANQAHEFPVKADCLTFIAWHKVTSLMAGK